MREVHDEDGARPVARVAHLVLERVVEDERGALLPPAWGGYGIRDRASVRVRVTDRLS